MNTQPPPGTRDIFPAEAALWRTVENTARRVFSLYGYGEIRTPIFEYTEVFQRGLGSETEVVQKEMYTFADRGGRSLTLRPEGTAGVIRALAGADAVNGPGTRVYYLGPMFRGERPAAGRRRQFHQIGVENVGQAAPALDAENIAMLCHFLEEIGLGGFTLLLNTRGTPADRKPAEDALRDHFAPRIGGLCEDCRERLVRNVWRILDCKRPQCQEHIAAAPDAAKLFAAPSRDYFDQVCQILSAWNIPFTAAPRLVRGLDYYVHTVFELTHPVLGGQNAIAGGGRYELTLPGMKTPVRGVGFAAGMERLLLARRPGQEPPALPGPEVYLVSLGAAALAQNRLLAARLRRRGISVMLEAEEKSLKSQMRSANRLNAQCVFILGEAELASGQAVLKHLADGSQEIIPVAALEERLAHGQARQRQY